MNELLSRLLAPFTVRQDSQLEQLANLLEVSIPQLRSIRTDPRYSYRPLTIRKRGGGRRQIAAPSSPLKTLQRKLLRRYLAGKPVHSAATAYRRGASIATHARRHLGQALLLNLDLTDFFPSTRASRLRRLLCEWGWQGEALQLLMRLCVYRGGLPQGAPTSPALSNLVNRPLDERLSELAAMHAARYSRYCDDLAFSWAVDQEPTAFRPQLENLLDHFGYQINLRKGWRLQRADQRPRITGLVLDGRRLRLPPEILARIRGLRRRWFRRTPREEQLLRGYRGLWGMLK